MGDPGRGIACVWPKSCPCCGAGGRWGDNLGTPSGAPYQRLSKISWDCGRSAVWRWYVRDSWDFRLIDTTEDSGCPLEEEDDDD